METCPRCDRVLIESLAGYLYCPGSEAEWHEYDESEGE